MRKDKPEGDNLNHYPSVNTYPQSRAFKIYMSKKEWIKKLSNNSLLKWSPYNDFNAE